MVINEVKLRPANAEDARDIVGWFLTHDSAIMWGGYEVPNPLTAEWLAAQFLDAQRRYYVLSDANDRVCGTYLLFHMAEERRVHLGRFAVRPDLRRQGLATLMIEHAVRIARSQQAETLTLKVYEENLIALSVYDRAGFRPTGDREVEKTLGGSVLLMALQL